MIKLPPKRVVYNSQIEFRLMSPRDGEAIYRGAAASLPDLKQFMSWAHFTGDLAAACSIYAEFEAKSLRGEEVNFAGFDLRTGEFLLCCSLVPGSRLNPLAFDMGYWVVSSMAGKGIGTIAAKTLVALAFREYLADRVSVVCNPENKRSLRVIEKTGFHFEGVLRNYLMRPTQEMIAAGYSPVVDARSYCLTREDIPSLVWFEGFCSELNVEYYHPQ